jgi:hypothetical protein
MGAELEDNKVDEILKQAYNEIEPPDSWKSLRCRIDQRIDGRTNAPAGIAGNVVFWRRLAIGMAACFLVTAGILLYRFGLSDGTQQSKHAMAEAADLLSQEDLNRLSLTFSQVRQLFGPQSLWIMIGSDDSTQMGVAESIVPGDSDRKLIVMRLAASLDGSDSQRQLFDIVAVADRRAELRLPVGGASPVAISLLPTVRRDGKIEVKIGTHAAKIDKTLGERFTSLVHLRTNGNWVNIDGTGRMLTEI